MSVRYAGARHAGLSEAKVAALDDLDRDVFTPRERVALRFAELMAVDHHKVDDAVFAELRRHFTDAEVVELGVSAALNLGLGRLTAILGVEPV
jgi:alkylhydroperoxidase family enzyme